jgi:hypothetical protein
MFFPHILLVQYNSKALTIMTAIILLFFSFVYSFSSGEHVNYYDDDKRGRFHSLRIFSLHIFFSLIYSLFHLYSHQCCSYCVWDVVAVGFFSVSFVNDKFLRAGTFMFRFFGAAFGKK